MPSRLSGPTRPSLAGSAFLTELTCDSLIAPGWKAVIWLLSRSVVIMAWAVNVPGISLMCAVEMPSFFR